MQPVATLGLRGQRPRVCRRHTTLPEAAIDVLIATDKEPSMSFYPTAPMPTQSPRGRWTWSI